MATKKSKEEPKLEYVVTDDWHLYRSREVVRVADFEDGSRVVAHADGSFSEAAADFDALYEPVKGMLKNA